VLIGLFVLVSPLAGWLSRRYRKQFYQRYPVESKDLPPLTIIKPVKGLDPEVLENYESLLLQNYPAPVQVVFAVEEESDPVVPLIRKLQARHPQRDIELVFSGPNPGIQGKCHNMLRGLRAARYDHLVFSDSDIRIPPQMLREIAAPLSDRRVGATCAPFRYNSQDRLWGPLTGVMMKEAAEFMQGLCLLGGFDSLMGGIMAIRHDTLEEIGGLEVIANELMDDVALGKRVHGAGYRIVLTPTPCVVIAEKEAFGSWFRYNHRWFLGLRTKNLASFVALLLNGYVFAALLTGLALVLSLPLWPYLLLWLALLLYRTFWAAGDEWFRLRRIARRIGQEGLDRMGYLDRARSYLKPLADLAVFFFLAAALLRPTVTWRGRRYRIDSQGQVLPLPA
jgi:ceramide glucosyltransferase